ncbi:MAG TPA: ArsA-related P-loop ATPase [Acidimicrobiales bacterium]|nr:ArsA-related P-loop ATPase [Acidimicrobiales bacterium]
MDARAFLTSSRVLVVAGKGGVGKSTVTAAVGLLAARLGIDTLLVDVEGTLALPTLFGRSSPLGYDEVVVAGPARTGGAALRARQITADDALVEYLDDHGLRRISKRLASTGTLDVVATAIPGIRDILVLGKIKSLELDRKAELVVVDAPAAGHAVTFLASARGLVDAVEVGPINQQAAAVAEMIADPARCEVMLVTLPEETPVNEAIETAYLLEDRAQVKLAPIVVNGVWAVLDLPPAAAAAAEAGASLLPAEVESLEAAATFRRRRQELQAAQVDRLAAGLPLPQLVLPQLMTTEIGPEHLGVLVDALADGIGGLP